MSADKPVMARQLKKLKEMSTSFTGVMSYGSYVCEAGHLLVGKISVHDWPEYKEIYIDFETEARDTITVVFPYEEFKKFVKLLNEVVSRA